MQTRILNLRYNFNFNLPINIIIEPDKKLWQNASQIVENIFRSLPGRIKKIQFLGSLKSYTAYTADEFAKESPGWLSENIDRVHLIGPLFEQIENKKNEQIILLICSEYPIDLDDWENSELLDNAVIVKLGDDNSQKDYVKNEINSLNIDDIIDKLNNPVELARIGNKFCFPLRWKERNNLKIQIEYVQNEGCYLRIQETIDKIDLHLQVLCANNEIPMLSVKRRRGTKMSNFNPMEEHAYFGDISYDKVPGELVSVIESFLANEYFVCPRCKRTHPPGTLLCPQDGLIFHGFPTNTVILLRYHENSFEWLPLYENEALNITSHVVISGKGGIYYLDSGGWAKIGELTQNFKEVAKDVWAFYHKT